MMDAKVQKRISDAVTDGTGRPDDSLRELLDADPEAAAYFEEIGALERKLRSWELVEPPRQYWKSFGSRLTPRLGAVSENNEEDPLTAPAPDDPSELDQQAGSEDHAEGADESEKKDADDGLDMLSALAGRSTLPPVKNFEESSGGPKDDGVLDIGALMAESEKKEKKEKKEKAAVAPSAECAEGEAPSPAAVASTRAVPPAQQKSSTGLYAVVGLLVVALAVVGYFAYTASEAARETALSANETVALSPGPSTPTISEDRTTEAQPTPAQSGEQQESETVTAPPTEEGVVTPGPEATGETDERGGTATKRSAARVGGTKSAPGEVGAAPTKTEPSPAQPAREPEQAPTKAGSSTSSLDDLLTGAVGSNRPAKTATPPAGGSAGDAVAAAVTDEGEAVPDQPSRSQVRRSMGSVAGQVMACRSLVRETTRVNATVTVANSGAVQSATVSGGAADVQACVERAVQRARFPRFTQPTFSVTYPFVLSPEE
jgi:hypothetical protein